MLTFGYCATAIILHGLSIAMVVFPFAFAWLRTSYLACLARQSGQKLINLEVTELFIGGLLLLALILVSVSLAGLLSAALTLEATRSLRGSFSLALLMAIIGGAFAFETWSPVLQPRRFSADDSQPPQAEESQLSRGSGFRFELGTLLLLITLLCVNLGLATVSTVGLLIVDAFLLMAAIAAEQFRRECRIRGKLNMADQLDLFCTAFLWIFAGVISAILTTMLLTEYRPVASPYHSVVFGEEEVGCNKSIAVGLGLVVAAIWRFFGQRVIRNRVPVLIERSRQAREAPASEEIT